MSSIVRVDTVPVNPTVVQGLRVKPKPGTVTVKRTQTLGRVAGLALVGMFLLWAFKQK